MKQSVTLLLFLGMPFLSVAAVIAGEETADTADDGKAIVPILTETTSERPWKFTLDTRLRWEYGDQDGLDEANAVTWRTRLGLLVNPFEGLSLFAEYEGTTAADRDSYRAASVHGSTTKTVIADPESHELNQLWLSYNQWDTEVKLGRQVIMLNNQRFVGAVAWRQNNQTYDAVTVTNQSVANLQLFYGYVNRVNRIFGSGDIANPAQEDFEGDTHLINATYTFSPELSLTGYAYFMGLHTPAGDGASNNSYGLQAKGVIPLGGDGAVKVPYLVDGAYQTDGAHSPADYGAWYYHANAGLNVGKFTVGAGFESLGSDGGTGFQTPLATLHAFNGWADLFLSIPRDGLNDAYLFADAAVTEKLNLQARFHAFGPDSGSMDYGTEVDAALVYSINSKMSVGAKYAYYFADEFGADTNRFVLDLGFKF
ncbi:MAG: alginate export family protein [Verrucomicrobiales bacterium]